MKIISKLKLFLFLILVGVISCNKDEDNSNKVSDWLEYTGYIPLPEKDAMWISEVTSEEIPLSGPVATLHRTVTNQYYLNGDSTINGVVYKKIYNKRIVLTHDSSDDNEIKDSATIYSGGLRQNIPDKKVFFIFASENTEKLIYDFDAEVGDSVSFYTTHEEKGVISCIDSTLIGNRYHEVFYVRIGGIQNSFYYIEGIGSSIGLIIEPDESLNGSWDIDFIEFKFKNESVNINWNSNPANCFN